MEVGLYDMSPVKFLSRPAPVFIFVIAASLVALAGALTAQFYFDLAPCELCLFQRVPFLIVIGLGIAGLALRRVPGAATVILALCAAAFFANAGIAFFHSGVELHWWKFGETGCAVPAPGAESSEEWIAKILSRPSVPCDIVAWRDPLFGFTMANLNVVYCLGLGAICALAAFAKKIK